MGNVHSPSGSSRRHALLKVKKYSVLSFCLSIMVRYSNNNKNQNSISSSIYNRHHDRPNMQLFLGTEQPCMHLIHGHRERMRLRLALM